MGHGWWVCGAWLVGLWGMTGGSMVYDWWVYGACLVGLWGLTGGSIGHVCGGLGLQCQSRVGCKI